MAKIEPAPGEGAYANPQPYDSPALERHILAGRIATAKKIANIYRKSGDQVRVARWQANIDRLLEHWSEADARAKSAALDHAVSSER